MKNYRISLLIALSFFYFSPFLILFKVASFSSHFQMALLTWTIIGFGVFIYLLSHFERKIKKHLAYFVSNRITQVEKKIFSDQKLQNPKLDITRVRILAKELEEKNKKEKMLTREIEHLTRKQEQEQEDFTELNEELQDQLDKKEIILSEYRDTLKEQRKIIEKKQEEINILQLRVNDLKYEIENLLKLKKEDESKSLFAMARKEGSSHEEDSRIDHFEIMSGSAEERLDKYVEMTTKFTGATHFSNQDSRYSGLSLGSLMIDQRRLFDRLQNEDVEVVLVYSREERRIIFINHQIKELSGWSPEKFIKDFSMFVQKGLASWYQAIEEVKLDSKRSFRILVKTRSGKDLLMHCHLKEVPAGPFHRHIVGILSPATDPS